MKPTVCSFQADAAVMARLRLSRLPDGARVRLAGRAGVFTYHGQQNGLAVLRAEGGAELRAGCLMVEPVEASA